MGTRMRRFGVAFAASATLLLSACGEDGDSDGLPFGSGNVGDTTSQAAEPPVAEESPAEESPAEAQAETSGPRPSVDEIKAGFTSGKFPEFEAFQSLPPDVLHCVAEAFHASDLSNATLQAIVDGDRGHAGSTEDMAALSGLREDAEACAKKVAGQG